MELVQYVFNMAIVVPIVLLLFFIAIKLGKTSFSKIGLHNHVSILEKVNLTKDSSIIVLKTGEVGRVCLISPGGLQIIQELNSEELKDIEDKKNQFLSQENTFNFNSFFKKDFDFNSFFKKKEEQEKVETDREAIDKECIDLIRKVNANKMKTK